METQLGSRKIKASTNINIFLYSNEVEGHVIGDFAWKHDDYL